MSSTTPPYNSSILEISLAFFTGMEPDNSSSTEIRSAFFPGLEPHNSSSTEISPAFFTGMQICIVLVMLVGIPSNVLTIVIICRYKRLHTSGSILIATLSLSDTLYYAYILPIRYSDCSNPLASVI